MSDSEIDMNKKTSIESCLKSEVSGQDHETPPIKNVKSEHDDEESEDKNQKNLLSKTSVCGKSKKPDKYLALISSGKPEISTIKEVPEPPPLFDEEPPTGSEVYFFESDHSALKHNTE